MLAEDQEGAEESFEEDLDPEPEELSEDEQAEIDNGEVCANCGGTFREEQGEPALCMQCWDAAAEADRVGYIRSNSTLTEA